MTAAWAKPQPPDLAVGLAYLTKHPDRYLFPLAVENPTVRPKGRPAIKDNLALASNDPAQLKRWYAEHKHRGRVLWGLSLKKSGLVGIDVDCGAGKVGEQSSATLVNEHGPFPATEVILSPSATAERRSRHLIYRGEHHFSAGKLGLNIDTPNYVLIAGTTFDDGRAYKLLRDEAPAPLPAWIADKIKPRSAERRNYVRDAIPLNVFQKMLDATPYTGGPPGLDNRHEYQGWLTFAMDCHEAAGGDEADYLDAFIQWCLNDPNAKASWTYESIERHWQSFTADPPAGAAGRTRASWFKLLAEIGHPEFIGEANPASRDFADDDDEPPLDHLIASWQKFDAQPEQVRRRREHAEWDAARARVRIPDRDRKPQR